MEPVHVRKLKNGYLVEIGYEDEAYLYPTRDELLAALPEMITRSETIHIEEESAKHKTIKAAVAADTTEAASIDTTVASQDPNNQQPQA